MRQEMLTEFWCENIMESIRTITYGKILCRVCVVSDGGILLLVVLYRVLVLCDS